MPSRSLIIATRNRHKVSEIAAILGASFACLSLDEVPSAPPVIEDAATFEGNALKKALSLATWLAEHPAEPVWPRLANTEAFVLADDSGLEVDVLNGAPGVHSARFAAPGSGTSGNSPDAANNAKLLKLLAAAPATQRTARFRCVLALVPLRTGVKPDELASAARLFSGACEGRISNAPAGRDGFGYDPLFVPDGFDRSFAELGEAVKNGISHRSRALAGLLEEFA
jgi:XTP/dITP diphosphohydrolase